MPKLTKSSLFLTILLIVIASLVHLSYELGYWIEWTNGIKNPKSMLWTMRLFNVALTTIALRRVLKTQKSNKNKCIHSFVAAGVTISSVLLAFAWALLLVALTGVLALPTLILEGLGGAALLLILLFVISKRALKKERKAEKV